MENQQKGLATIAIALIIILIAGGGYVVYKNYHKESSMVGSTSSNFVTSTDVTIWKTYSNDTYGFSFKYPTDPQFQTPKNASVIFPVKEGVEADVPGTLISYNMYVGVTPATTQDQCMSSDYAIYNDQITPPKPVTINNIIFNTYLKSDNDMGGGSLQTTYATWKNNVCYALSSYVHQSDLSKKYENSDPNKVVAEKNVQAELQKINDKAQGILSSFNFF